MQNPYVTNSPLFANFYHREYQFRSDFRSQFERLVEFPSQLSLLLPYLTKRQRDVLRSRAKRSHLLDVDRGYHQYLDIIRNFAGTEESISNLPCWSLGLLPHSDLASECPVEGWFPCDDDSLAVALEKHYSSIGPTIFKRLDCPRTKWKLRSKVAVATALAEHYEGKPLFNRNMEHLKSFWKTRKWHPVQGILCGGSARGSQILLGDNKEYEKDDDGSISYFNILDRSFDFFNFQESMRIVEEIGSFLEENKQDLNTFARLNIRKDVKFWILSECFGNLESCHREELMNLFPKSPFNGFFLLKRKEQQERIENYVFELLNEKNAKMLAKLMASLQKDVQWKIKLPDFILLEVMRKIQNDSEFCHLRGRKWENNLFLKLVNKYDELQVPSRLTLERELKRSSMEENKFAQTKFSNLAKRPASRDEISLNVNSLVGLLKFSCESRTRMSGIYKPLKNVPVYWIYFIRACVILNNVGLIKEAFETCLKIQEMSKDLLVPSLINIKEEIVLTNDPELLKLYACTLERLPQVFYFSGLVDFVSRLRENDMEDQIVKISHHFESQQRTN
ncbi:unnamed protein product [Oikopleura dioica]|uniref:Uncharacterized protein n=1 Tax=Oikopleura dioica TaxID=34765 RepID=E4YHT1_OIKDI|nr:unnamed protein product [Oikopleura dioica]